MRDRRFVAQHRGGPLSKRNHQLMALWAADCAEHILTAVWKNKKDRRPFEAVRLARAWARGEISVGEACKASVAAHAAARAAKDPAAKAAARAAGHAVATAHMADHCLGPMIYGVRAAELAGLDADNEREWQEVHQPQAIKALVKDAITKKTRKSS